MWNILTKSFHSNEMLLFFNSEDADDTDPKPVLPVPAPTAFPVARIPAVRQSLVRNDSSDFRSWRRSAFKAASLFRRFRFP